MTSNGRRPYGEGKPKCGGNRPSVNLPCERPAGWGTDHPGVGRCKRHGGSSPTHVVHAQKVQAAELVERYGAPRRIDPRDGLVEEYWRTAGAVAYCESRVHALADGELVWGVVEESDAEAGPSAGTTTKRRAVPHAWLALYQQERDRFAKLGVEIIRLGLEAQRDAAAERQSLQLAGVIRLFVAELGLTAEQQARVPLALQAAIAAVGGAGERVIEGKAS